MIKKSLIFSPKRLTHNSPFFLKLIFLILTHGAILIYFFFDRIYTLMAVEETKKILPENGDAYLLISTREGKQLIFHRKAIYKATGRQNQWRLWDCRVLRCRNRPCPQYPSGPRIYTPQTARGISRP